MNLEHLVMPERKKRGGGKKLHNGGPYQRTPDVRALSGWSWNNLSKIINVVELDVTKYKINTYEYININFIEWMT